MTALHAYFHQRNQQAFQRLLDPSRGSGGGPSTSGGKSWSRPSPLTAAAAVDVNVNARDFLGRTVLHLAAASSDASAPEFVRLLLAHPAISVNAADAESHWTALHRALYHGNLATAQLLLQRPDIDTAARDVEGYTPFDLYNSTIEGTVPDHESSRGKELFTWGSNRNAALGVGDGDDRVSPELVTLRAPSAVDAKENVDARFTPIRVREIAMSRLHTVIVTDEPRGNLRVCGFGSGGRLGPGQHTQYTPIPIPGFTHTVISVAVGQDHTLILTKGGEVFSWGLNRFSQLGYVLDTPSGARSEEPIQSTPRKIAGAIKLRKIEGVAACKTASACWTSENVFTWGTNSGQLGYDRAAQPVQTVPRVVTKVTRPVLSISITDSAMACLLDSQEVICFWNDGHYKVNFPAYSFPSEFVAYRPPQGRNSASIAKIISCEDTFATLSLSGELFTFHLQAPSEGAASVSKNRFNVQPQRVWALRKQFSAVRDVALGVDGTIIICTESGHVFVRSRNLKAGQGAAKAFKFQRMPHLQRVTRVCANATGAFAVLRDDWMPDEVSVTGNRLPQDLALVQPYLHLNIAKPDEDDTAQLEVMDPMFEEEEEEEEEDATVLGDIQQLDALCSVILRLKEARKGGDGPKAIDPQTMPYDASLVVHVQSTGIELPAHRALLAARSSRLCRALSEGTTLNDVNPNVSVQGHIGKAATRKLPKLTFAGCHPLSVLVLLVYLYTDEPLAVWDPRIGHALQKQLQLVKVKPAQVKSELQALANVLELQALADVLDSPVKRTPKPTLVLDLQKLFAETHLAKADASTGNRMQRPLAPDITLQLADREVMCHSVVLRARSPFFAAFFDDKDWTRKRWTPEGSIVVNLQHLKWRAAEPVLKYMCYGGDQEIFDVVEDVSSPDELIDFLFEVMAIANELHLHRLILICSRAILKRVWVNNVCSVLTDATHYHATALVQSLQRYMAINMEVFLESRMLDDLAPDLVKQLSVLVREQQALKYPVSRSTQIIDKAMEVWGDWLALQDIPQPIVPTFRTGGFRDSTKLSPPVSSKRQTRHSDASLPGSPMLHPAFTSRTPVAGIPDDEMFMMDEPELTPTPSAPVCAPGMLPRVPSGSESPARQTGWRAITSAPKADMKAIMAEAATPPRPVALTHAGEPARGTPPRSSLESPGKTGGIPRVPSGSWRIPQPPAVPRTPPVGSPSMSVMVASPGKDRTTFADSAPGATTGQPAPTPSSSTRPSQQQPTTPRKPVAPGLGPVFTPTKQASPSAASSIRRVSSGNVWTPPPVQPVVQPSPSSSTPTPAMSFAAIQRSQAQTAPSTKKENRSLVEIQEEERARQVEADFLRWWAAEEDRLRAEEAATTALIASATGGEAPKRPKKTKKSKTAPGAGAGAPRQGPDQQQPKAAKQPSREKAGGQDGPPGQGGKPRRRKPTQSQPDSRRPDARMVPSS